VGIPQGGWSINKLKPVSGKVRFVFAAKYRRDSVNRISRGMAHGLDTDRGFSHVHQIVMRNPKYKTASKWLI
jgi:hypothetical protein